MDRHAQKVFLAVAFGVGLGILAGRALGGAFSWMLGAVLGGASAYVLFAPIAALRAIPRAYRAARGRWPSTEEWEVIRWHLWAVLAPCTTMLAVVFPIAWRDKDGPRLVTTLGGWFQIGVVAAFLGAILAVVMVAFAGLVVDETCPAGCTHHSRTARLRQLRFMATHALLPVLVLWNLPRFAWWIVRVGIPATVGFARRIGWHWFRLVHSDLRTICLADAFLFAGIGTLVGGPILAWMVGGGTFGVLNYRIVSIRILKLHPVATTE